MSSSSTTLRLLDIKAAYAESTKYYTLQLTGSSNGSYGLLFQSEADALQWARAHIVATLPSFKYAEDMAAHMKEEMEMQAMGTRSYTHFKEPSCVGYFPSEGRMLVLAVQELWLASPDLLATVG